MSTKPLTEVIIKRTLKVPQTIETQGGLVSPAIARQLDIALVSEGFKASPALMEYVASLNSANATELSNHVLNAVKDLIGSKVNHNVYFKEFPNNIPDTIEFWTELVTRTYGEGNESLWNGNLLELDGYGKYAHSYEEMVAAQEEFMPQVKRKAKILHLGSTLQGESYSLYLSLAESTVVANEDDVKLLDQLATIHVNDPQPERIPVRENRAVINQARLNAEQPILVDTVTDVLRLAVFLSGGDVSLKTNTKFRKFNYKERFAMIKALEDIVSANKNKLGDVYKHRKQLKKLAYRLYLYKYKHFKNARMVFKTAWNDVNLSFEARVEKAFAEGNTEEVVNLLKNAPGLFVRNLNRILLNAKLGELKTVTNSLEKVVEKVETPTLVSLRQYLNNRTEQKVNRLFINKKGTGKVVPDEQPTLSDESLFPINKVIDEEVQRRLPEGNYLVNKDILKVALPLSNRQTNEGFATMPRGSSETVEGDVLRFFSYWKEKSSRTDFDLSAIVFDGEFKQLGQLSFTNLRLANGVHSGDITESRQGASEFIDIDIPTVSRRLNSEPKYVVPQVNVYSGEGFNEVEESFFGYMVRNAAEKGKPFEPTTVKTKAELRGTNRVALPFVVILNGDGTATVKWANMFLRGYAWNNRTENNTLNSATIMGSIVETEYLTVEYLVDLLARKENTTVTYTDEYESRDDFEDRTESLSDITYIGMSHTDLVSDITDIKSITLSNLHELL